MTYNLCDDCGHHKAIHVEYDGEEEYCIQCRMEERKDFRHKYKYPKLTKEEEKLYGACYSEEKK